MKLNDVYLGQKVLVTATMPDDDDYCGDTTFDFESLGLIGRVSQLDSGDDECNVLVEFDDGRQDWGNHAHLIRAEDPWHHPLHSQHISTAVLGDPHISNDTPYVPLEFIPAGNEVLTRDTIRDKLDQIESLVDQIRNQMGL